MHFKAMGVWQNGHRCPYCPYYGVKSHKLNADNTKFTIKIKNSKYFCTVFMLDK